MAIDTVEKRRSAAGVPFFLGLGVTPNASKDQEWRQQAGWSYSGILAGEAADVPDVIIPINLAITLPQSISMTITLPQAINSTITTEAN